MKPYDPKSIKEYTLKLNDNDIQEVIYSFNHAISHHNKPPVTTFNKEVVDILWRIKCQLLYDLAEYRETGETDWRYR